MLTNARVKAETTSGIHVERVGKPCQVWRRNGKTKTWKRTPGRWALPTKWGLYQYNTFTELDEDISRFHFAEDCDET